MCWILTLYDVYAVKHTHAEIEWMIWVLVKLKLSWSSLSKCTDSRKFLASIGSGLSLFECAVLPAPLSFLGADPVCTLFYLRFVFVVHFNISCLSSLSVPIEQKFYFDLSITIHNIQTHILRMHLVLFIRHVSDWVGRHV